MFDLNATWSDTIRLCQARADVSTGGPQKEGRTFDNHVQNLSTDASNLKSAAFWERGKIFVMQSESVLLSPVVNEIERFCRHLHGDSLEEDDRTALIGQDKCTVFDISDNVSKK